MTSIPRPTCRPGQPEPDDTPDAKKKSQRMDPGFVPGAWQPEYIVVLTINPDLRASNPHWPLSLEEALNLGRQPHHTIRSPQPDLEAEP